MIDWWSGLGAGCGIGMIAGALLWRALNSEMYCRCMLGRHADGCQTRGGVHQAEIVRIGRTNWWDKCWCCTKNLLEPRVAKAAITKNGLHFCSEACCEEYTVNGTIRGSDGKMRGMPRSRAKGLESQK